jgi:hypothetical protein
MTGIISTNTSLVLTKYMFSVACPMTQTVNVAISFGVQKRAISPDDIKLAQISSGQCFGAIFVFTPPSSGPGWIVTVGDMFLKNVYTTFRANTASVASVGFAALAPGAQRSVTRNGVPTTTIGSAGVGVTGSGHNRNAVLPAWSRTSFFFADKHFSLLLCKGLLRVGNDRHYGCISGSTVILDAVMFCLHNFVRNDLVTCCGRWT